MKSKLYLLLLYYIFNCSIPSVLSAQSDAESKVPSSSFGIVAGYNESIVRDTRSYYYPHEYYKEYHPEKFRGYSIGLTYNTDFQDNVGFATLTVEALLQTLPMFYESYFGIRDTIFGDYYPSKMVSNHSSNTMATLNSLYNINLFNSGFSVSFGGSIAYIFNKQYKKTVEIDSTILWLIETKTITPIEPVVFGKEVSIEPDSPLINPFLLAMLIGLNYKVYIASTEIEPFIRYNHSFNFHSSFTLEDLFLHGFQSGLSVRFPF